MGSKDELVARESQSRTMTLFKATHYWAASASANQPETTTTTTTSGDETSAPHTNERGIVASLEGARHWSKKGGQHTYTNCGGGWGSYHKSSLVWSGLVAGEGY